MKKDKSKNEPINDDGSYVVKKSRKLNILAFILCVAASFFIWIYVMNTQNSDYTKTFSISVEVINEDDLLSATGLGIFGEVEKTAVVTIQGTKSDVQKYSEKDFRAYIDASSIKEKGNTPLSVVVETPTAAVSVVSVEPKTITVYADQLEEKTVKIDPYCNGDHDNTLLLSSDIKNIKISGPSTYVEKVVSARVNVPHRNNYKVGDTIVASDIRIYDADNKQLSSLHITFDHESIVVKVDAVNE